MVVSTQKSVLQPEIRICSMPSIRSFVSSVVSKNTEARCFSTIRSSGRIASATSSMKSTSQVPRRQGAQRMVEGQIGLDQRGHVGRVHGGLHLRQCLLHGRELALAGALCGELRGE